jgi:hypothetical protein
MQKPILGYSKEIRIAIGAHIYCTTEGLDTKERSTVAAIFWKRCFLNAYTFLNGHQKCASES